MKLEYVCAITFSPIVYPDRMRLVDTDSETIRKQYAIIQLIENMIKMPVPLTQGESLTRLGVLLNEIKRRSESANVTPIQYFWLFRQG